MNRRGFLAASLGSAAVVALGAEATRPNLGLLLYSYGIRLRVDKAQGFGDPVRFVEFARQRGGTAVQLSLGIQTTADSERIRKASDQSGVQIEAIISPPKETLADQERFTAELATAQACGVTVARTVMLGGRRYEVFERADQFPAFFKDSEAALKRAEPVAAKFRIQLAVENHKDFRIDEQIDLLKRISSDWVGVCLDTGNNLALLEDPQATVEALAPFTRTVHLKDISLEESADGFRMAEVPLGQGCFDLPKMVATVRRFNPSARFQLEMITRDPLSIPCLSEKYWATLGRVPGTDLARTLARVKSVARREPLPRVSGMTTPEQVDIEERHVRESFDYAVRTSLIST
jgi:sugar phosphate isomerase/epimerase